MTQAAGWRAELAAPVFAVRDMALAIACYRDKIGFDIAFQWPLASSFENPANCPDYVILRLGNCELHLSKNSTVTPAIAYFFIDGIDDCYVTLAAANAPIAVPIATQPWDMREFEINDPDGNVLIFGEHTSRLSSTKD